MFWRTVMCGNRLNDWKTIPIWARIPWTWRSELSTFSPSKRMVPESIGSSPLMQRSIVDLPDPEGPATTIASPRSIFSSIPSRTRLSPKLLRTEASSTRLPLAAALLSMCPDSTPGARGGGARGYLGQVRLARVDDLRIGEHIDQGGLARGEGAVEGRAQLVGAAHQLAMAAEGRNHLVVAGLGTQLGGQRVAVEEFHRVVLERPDAVVPHNGDDRQIVAGHRVELHTREAEGAVAEQQADLALGVGELGADRLAGPRTEAAVGAGVHPGAGLPGLPDPPREADEVAAVADHDRVAVEEVTELLVDAHRMKRGAIVVEHLLLLGALLGLGAAQLLDPAGGAAGARGVG